MADGCPPDRCQAGLPECEKDGSLPDEKLEAVIGPKVKLAAIGHVSNVLGCVNPVEKVIELVHRNGGVVLVDAAQSAPT